MFPARHAGEFERFRYTGTLRAFPVTERMQVPKHIVLPDYALDGVCVCSSQAPACECCVCVRACVCESAV